MSVAAGKIIDASTGDTGTDRDRESPVSATADSDGRDPGRVDGVDGKSEPEPIRGYDSFNPSTGDFEPIASQPGLDAEPRQRRKRGPNKPKQFDPKTGGPSIGELDFGSILLSTHQMLAAITGIEEIGMDDKKEADKLGKAISHALKFHPAGISPERLAYVNLACVVGEIYGSRALAYRMRKLEERKNRPRPAATPIRQTAPVAPPPQAQARTQSGPTPTGTYGALSPDQIWSQPAEE
jgi:hypothetical protein